MRFALLALALPACYSPDDHVEFSAAPETYACIEIEDYERCHVEGGVCVDAGLETLTCVPLERRCEFGPFEGCEDAPLRTP